MEALSKDLWVFIETDEEGKARNVGLELLNPGRRLADAQGGALVAVVIGYKTEAAVKEAAAYGADKIIVVDGEEYQHYTTDAYADAMYALVTKYGPTTMMIGATNEGRDMGPRLSCRLRTGLTADCTAVDYDEETGNIAWTVPTFRWKPSATISVRIIVRRSELYVRAYLRRVRETRITSLRSLQKISTLQQNVSVPVW